MQVAAMDAPCADGSGACPPLSLAHLVHRWPVGVRWTTSRARPATCRPGGDARGRMRHRLGGGGARDGRAGLPERELGAVVGVFRHVCASRTRWLVGSPAGSQAGRDESRGPCLHSAVRRRDACSGLNITVVRWKVRYVSTLWPADRSAESRSAPGRHQRLSIYGRSLRRRGPLRREVLR